MDRNILKKCNDELSKLNENLTVEKKSRDESETAIYDMLKDVVTKVKGEIDSEKRSR